MAVVGHAQDRPPDERELDLDLVRPRVLDDVGQALLRHAVDHELLLGGQLRHRAARVERRADSWAWSVKSRIWLCSAGSSRWSSSTPGRSWRASASSSSIACAESRLVSEQEARGACPQQLLDRCLEPKRNCRQRLIDLIVQILRDPAPLTLLRLNHREPGLSSLGLQPRDHPMKRRLEPAHLFAVRIARGQQLMIRRPQIDPLHGDQLVQRLEPAPEYNSSQLPEQRGHDCEPRSRTPRDRAPRR